MIVTDRDKETLASYAAVFIHPLLRQGTQVSYKIPICADGIGSPEIGELVIEPDAKSGIKVIEVEDTPEGPRVIAVYKPGKNPSYRRTPSVPFARSLREQVDHHVEAQGKYRERAEKLGVQDIAYNQLPSSENAGYVKYGDDLDPNNFGFASAAFANDEGVYFSENYEKPREGGWTNSGTMNTAEVEQMRERVIRSVFSITLEEELYERKALEVVRGLSNVLVRDTIGKQVDLSKTRVKPEGFTYVRAVRQDNGCVKFSVDVSMFTGLEKKGGQVISDHKYLSSVLKGLKRIDGIGPYDGLHFERKRDPESTDLTKSKQPNKPHYPYLVKAIYVAELTKDTLSAIYVEQKQLAA